MKQTRPILHGRDHAAGGADPIPGLGGGGGINFALTNTGTWLDIRTTGVSGISPFRGIYLEAAGGDMKLSTKSDHNLLLDTTGLGDISLNASDALQMSGKSVTLGAFPSGGSGGSVNITARGPGILNLFGTGTGADVTISSSRDLVMSASRNILVGAPLPTADPHVANAIWNSSGTVKVSAG